MVRKVRLAICVLTLFVCQTAIVQRFSVHHIRPDLLLLLAAYVGLEADYRHALPATFLVGLIRDLGTCGRIGASPLLLVPLCAGLIATRDHVLRESFWTDLVLATIFYCAFSVGEALLNILLISQASVRTLAVQGAGQTALTAALTPLLFAMLASIGITRPSPDAALRA
jgi:rod shape-determining protein MreD